MGASAGHIVRDRINSEARLDSTMTSSMINTGGYDVIRKDLGMVGVYVSVFAVL